jgi:hypothetical protein
MRMVAPPQATVARIRRPEVCGFRRVNDWFCDDPGFCSRTHAGVKGAALLVPDDHMLHRLPDATDFDTRRQLGELETVVTSEAGSRFLTETYTGWPRVH